MKITTVFTYSGLWGSSYSPDGHTLSGKQAVMTRVFLLFVSKGEKRFFLPWLTLTIQPRAVCFMAEPVTVSAAVIKTCRLSCALRLLQKMMLLFVFFFFLAEKGSCKPGPNRIISDV